MGLGLTIHFPSLTPVQTPHSILPFPLLTIAKHADEVKEKRRAWMLNLIAYVMMWPITRRCGVSAIVATCMHFSPRLTSSVFGNSELGEWELRGGSSLGDWAWEVDIYSHSLVWYLMGIPIEIWERGVYYFSLLGFDTWCVQTSLVIFSKTKKKSGD